MSNAKEEARFALRNAEMAARRGDLRQAERWSKMAERMSQAALNIEAAPEQFPSPEEELALREELRRRLTMFANADRELAEWESECEAYESNLIAAIGNGTEPPPPLRPRPGAPLDAEGYLAAIAKGEF